ncbi:hypothetical protein, partial [Frankia canadensis]|uniref:hypothetical protein n=1 Tax=Frankia canadensis TaxID=1836972 RepID=UPI001056CB52
MEVGADAAVRELGFRQFGASGEFGLVLDGEPFGPEVPVAMCGIVDGVEVAPAVPVDGYRSGFGGGLTASSLYVWQDDAADAWWEPTAAPLGGDFAAAASDSMSDSDADWWTPAPTSRNKRSEPLLGSLAGAPAGGLDDGAGAGRREQRGGRLQFDHDPGVLPVVV